MSKPKDTEIEKQSSEMFFEGEDNDTESNRISQPEIQNPPLRVKPAHPNHEGLKFDINKRYYTISTKLLTFTIPALQNTMCWFIFIYSNSFYSSETRFLVSLRAI